MSRIGSPPGLFVRLRRSLGVSGVLFLSLTAALCGDDDDDDDGDGGMIGPSSDCIDEFADVLDEFGFDEDDVEPIGVGGNESGALTASDLEFDGYFFDMWILGLEDDEEVTIQVNPSGFDAYVTLYDSQGSFITSVDDPDNEAATETLVMDFDEGCYAIEVSSYETGETGSYSISVD